MMNLQTHMEDISMNRELRPGDIQLRNTSQQFEYEKISREIDQCEDIDTLRDTCKFLVKLEMKTRENYSIMFQDLQNALPNLPDISQPKE